MSKRRGKRRRKGRVPPHLKKYLFKKKRGRGRKRRRHHKRGHAMARRKRRRSHHRGGARRRRRSGGGGGRGWLPAREDLHLFAAGGAIGYLESQAASDANHVLNKIPRPVHQLGYTGGTALAAWVVGKFTGNRWAKLIARAAATAAAYQMGRHGGLLADSSTVPTTLSGEFLDMGHEEELIDENIMGVLDAEGSSMDGLPFDGTVEEADAHV